MINPAHWRWRGRLVLAFGLGVLLAQALAPLHVVLTVPMALGGVFVLFTRAETMRRAAWIGWIFGVGYFGAGLSWIVEPFQVDPDRHAWMAPFALVFLAGGLSLFWAVAFGLAARTGGQGWGAVLALTVWMSMAEFARAYVLTGLPWAAFGQFWIDTPAAQVLQWIGPQGLAVLTVFAGLSVGLAARPGVRLLGRALALLPAMLGVALALALPEPSAFATGEKVVRLVQPNAPQDQKWDPAYRDLFFSRQMGFTAAEGELGQPDLIVWPETAVPVMMEHSGSVFDRIALQAGGAQVILGQQRSDGEKYFNSLAVIDPQGNLIARYDKRHLVPFGEYVPFGDLLARVGIFGFATQMGSGFSPGTDEPIVTLTGFGAVRPLICYEAVFPEEIQSGSQRPDLLVQITNDAWFGTYSGPYQHLVQARMRAIEQGVPMIRAANTGVSAVIDPAGRLVASLALGQAGFVDARVPKPVQATLYSRSGDWPVLGVLLFCLGGLQLLHSRSAHSRRDTIGD
ncbi:apolipoprotein N-acyltransferase [Aliisedimentitalea scapharcae]|uniref:Apolipoprotein N-acyltransferase n=1 Tax=Aliisedimentitalea scapharcae TaxID=1524259 RepID=A0ABZ2XUA6_9RHOB